MNASIGKIGMDTMVTMWGAADGPSVLWSRAFCAMEQQMGLLCYGEGPSVLWSSRWAFCAMEQQMGLLCYGEADGPSVLWRRAFCAMEKGSHPCPTVLSHYSPQPHSTVNKLS